MPGYTVENMRPLDPYSKFGIIKKNLDVRWVAFDEEGQIIDVFKATERVPSGEDKDAIDAAAEASNRQLGELSAWLSDNKEYLDQLVDRVNWGNSRKLRSYIAQRYSDFSIGEKQINKNGHPAEFDQCNSGSGPWSWDDSECDGAVRYMIKGMADLYRENSGELKKTTKEMAREIWDYLDEGMLDNDSIEGIGDDSGRQSEVASMIESLAGEKKFELLYLTHYLQNRRMHERMFEQLSGVAAARVKSVMVDFLSQNIPEEEKIFEKAADRSGENPADITGPYLQDPGLDRFFTALWDESAIYFRKTFGMLHVEKTYGDGVDVMDGAGVAYFHTKWRHKMKKKTAKKLWTSEIKTTIEEQTGRGKTCMPCHKSDKSKRYYEPELTWQQNVDFRHEVCDTCHSTHLEAIESLAPSFSPAIAAGDELFNSTYLGGIRSRGNGCHECHHDLGGRADTKVKGTPAEQTMTEREKMMAARAAEALTRRAADQRMPESCGPGGCHAGVLWNNKMNAFARVKYRKIFEDSYTKVLLDLEKSKEKVETDEGVPGAAVETEAATAVDAGVVEIK